MRRTNTIFFAQITEMIQKCSKSINPISVPFWYSCCMPLCFRGWKDMVLTRFFIIELTSHALHSAPPFKRLNSTNFPNISLVEKKSHTFLCSKWIPVNINKKKSKSILYLCFDFCYHAKKPTPSFRCTTVWRFDRKTDHQQILYYFFVPLWKISFYFDCIDFFENKTNVMQSENRTP